MKQRGYIFTVSTFFLLTSVLILSLFFSSKSEEMDFAGPKLAALYDDIRTDVYEMLDLKVSVANYTNFTVISFNESIPAKGIESDLASYEEFIEKNFTSEVDAKIDDRVASMGAADVSMAFWNSTLAIKPYNYFYKYSELTKETLLLHPTDNNTYLRGIILNMTLDRNVFNVESNITEGDFPIYIYARKGNITYAEDFLVSREDHSEWELNLSGSKIFLEFGQRWIGADSRDATFFMQLEGNADVERDLRLVFDKAPFVELESGFTITIRDLLGHRKVLKEDSQFEELIDFTRIRDWMYFPITRIELIELPIDPAWGGSFPGGEEEEEEEEEGGSGQPYEPPLLLGYCYCPAPCYYWEYYYEREPACYLRSCPDWCDPGLEMLTYWL